jgi:O-antigen chain-terminating methyltransferase
MVAPFYRAFEDRHRGSRELILERLKVYLPFLEPLKALEADPVVLDLGCGRGEWLEMVTDAGFTATGVDLDEGMLEGCRVRGLPAERDDAVGALKKRADDSLSVISAFHLVEHIPFTALQELIAESLRVLKPGGLLILETPNAENLFVGSNGFYMDPTHEKPIPHLLLSFLTEFTGFDRTKLLRLQEQSELHDQNKTIDLITALGSASPDYAIVAQKNAPESVAALFDEPFARIFGITPGELAARYDQRIDTRFENLEVKMDGVSALTENFLQRLTELNTELSSVRDQNSALAHQNGALLTRNDSLEATVQALQARLSQAEANHSAADSALNAVVHSASWKITYPLRKVSSLVRGGKPTSQTTSFKRSLALRAINFVAARPRLKRVAVIAANRLPRSLKAKLSAIAIISGAPVSASNGPVSGTPLLSMREADIYLELKHALERKESK